MLTCLHYVLHIYVVLKRTQICGPIIMFRLYSVPQILYIVFKRIHISGPIEMLGIR